MGQSCSLIVAACLVTTDCIVEMGDCDKCYITVAAEHKDNADIPDQKANLSVVRRYKFDRNGLTYLRAAVALTVWGYVLTLCVLGRRLFPREVTVEQQCKGGGIILPSASSRRSLITLTEAAALLGR